MTFDFAHLLPEAKTWVKSLVTVWPAPIIKESSWMFPAILCGHILSLTVLGGAILLPSLRLIGVGMTEQSSASIEKTMRPWLIGALIVLIITGTLMGIVNPMKLYTRAAFTVKMMALVAALILSFGAVRLIAGRDGVATQQAKILAAVGALIWLASVVIFGTSYGAAPGMFHVISIAWLIVMVFGSKMTRMILGGITAVVVVVVGGITYGLYNPLESYDMFFNINRWTLRVVAVLITGLLLWEFTRKREANMNSSALNRLVGVFSILAWFTVAAAGRWIGLGTGGQ